MNSQNTWATVIVGAIIAVLVLINGNKIDTVRKEFVDHRSNISLKLAESIINNPVDNSENETTECDGSGWIVQGDGHKTECPGCKNCQGTGKVDDNCKCGDNCKCVDCKCKNCNCPNCPTIPKEIEDCPEWLEDFQGGRPDKTEEKPPLSDKIAEEDNYDPEWNVEGSWEKAKNREELIDHLNKGLHNFKRYGENGLESYSTDDLQRIHDQHHEELEKQNKIKIRSFNIESTRTSNCPGGVCPTPIGGGRLLRIWR